jgi:hypothetical protein
MKRLIPARMSPTHVVFDSGQRRIVVETDIGVLLSYQASKWNLLKVAGRTLKFEGNAIVFAPCRRPSCRPLISLDFGRSWRVAKRLPWTASNIASGRKDIMMASVGLPIGPLTPESGAYLSKGGTACWGKTSLGRPVNNVVITNAQGSDALAVISAPTGVVVTHDFGRKWSPGSKLPSDLDVEAIGSDPTDTAHVAIAAEGGGVYFSRDGGDRWSEARGMRSKDVTSIALSGRHMYAAVLVDETAKYNQTRIWASEDGGEHWRMTSMKTDYDVPAINARTGRPIAIIQGGHLLVRSDKSGAWKVVG